jgi:hypothetical protein
MTVIVAEIKVQVHGDAAMATIRNRMSRGLGAGASLLVTRTQAVLDRPNTGVSVIRTRNTRRGPKGSSYTIYPNPAPQGQPPHLRTGIGRRSLGFKKIDWNEWHVRWQRIAFYMALQEIGYRPKSRSGKRGRFQKRPSLLPTLQLGERPIRAIIAAYAGQGA